MLRIQIPLSWQGKTTYAHTVSGALQHLLLPGFEVIYVSGPWGHILSQCIKGPFFCYNIHHLDIKAADTVDISFSDDTLTLHKLIKGNIRCVVNDNVLFQLSPEKSQFFHLSARNRSSTWKKISLPKILS